MTSDPETGYVCKIDSSITFPYALSFFLSRCAFRLSSVLGDLVAVGAFNILHPGSPLSIAQKVTLKQINTAASIFPWAKSSQLPNREQLSNDDASVTCCCR